MKRIGLVALMACVLIPLFIHTAYAQTSQEKSYIGVNVQNITEDLIKSFNLKTNKGVMVTEVVEGSPGDKARIKKGDVITAFDGRGFQDSRDLALIVAATPIDKEVPIRFFVGEREVIPIIKVGKIAQATVYS